MQHRSETAFQVRANRICTRINTSPFLDTKARYDHDLRKTEKGLTELARLHAPRSKRSTYRALLAHMQRIYVFTKAHVPAEIALARQGNRELKRWMRGGPKPGPFGRRFAALTTRQVGRDYDEKFRDARLLGLTACNTVSGTGTGAGRASS
jgi:hypothetical protein